MRRRIPLVEKTASSIGFGVARTAELNVFPPPVCPVCPLRLVLPPPLQARSQARSQLQSRPDPDLIHGPVQREYPQECLLHDPLSLLFMGWRQALLLFPRLPLRWGR